MAVDPAKTYAGKPCPYGHGTMRWRCNRSCVVCERDRTREGMRRAYAALSGVEYNELLLKHRRHKGLARMAARNEGRP